MVYFSLHFAWSHCACLICLISFLHTMIKLCCCVSGVTYSYDSRAYQILELGVSEFCSTVPNSHIKFRVCFRVLSRIQRGRLQGWILSTILLALFRAKFACILAISNPVFRWESCKGSVWESVKKCSRLCKEAGAHDWILRVACSLQAAKKVHMCQARQKLKSHASCCTTGQKF